MRPLVERVSPGAVKSIDEFETLRKWETVALGTGILLFILSSTLSDDAKTNTYNAGMIFVLGSIPLGFISYNSLANTAQKFNQDLRKNSIPPLA